MKKKVLLTGAAGFIGFHLAQRLHARGDGVIGYDNFNDYYSVELKRERERLLKEKGIEIVEGDIGNEAQLEALIQQQQTTHLIHLAAQAGVRYSLTHPQSYVHTNLDGFARVLEVC